MSDPIYRLTEVVDEKEEPALRRLLDLAFNSLENLSSAVQDLVDGKPVRKSHLTDAIQLAQKDADEIAKVLGYRERRDR